MSINHEYKTLTERMKQLRGIIPNQSLGRHFNLFHFFRSVNDRFGFILVVMGLI